MCTAGVQHTAEPLPSSLRDSPWRGIHRKALSGKSEGKAREEKHCSEHQHHCRLHLVSSINRRAATLRRRRLMPLMRTPLLVLPGCSLECPHLSPHAACPYVLQKGCLKTWEGKGWRGKGMRYFSGQGVPALINSTFLSARLESCQPHPTDHSRARCRLFSEDKCSFRGRGEQEYL